MEGAKEKEVSVVPKLFFLLYDAASTALLYLFETKVRAAGEESIYDFVCNNQAGFNKIKKKLRKKIELDELKEPAQLDVSVLCSLLLGYSDGKADNLSLTPVETNAVIDIRNARNKIAHVGSAGGEQESFLKLWTKVVEGITTIDGSLDRNQQRQEIKEKIARASSGKEVSISLKSIQQLEEFDKVIKDMIKMCWELETEYAAVTTSQASEMTRIVQKLPEHVQLLKEKLKKTMQGFSYEKILPEKITLGVKLMIRTDSEENTDTIYEMLLTLFNGVIENKPDTETLDDLAKEVKIIANNLQGQHGVSSVRGEAGSVKLAIDMQSPAGILDLLGYLEGGEAEDVLQNISTALSEKFRQSVTITAELDEPSVASLEKSVAEEDQQVDLPVNDKCLKHPRYKYTEYCEEHKELVCEVCAGTDHVDCKTTDLQRKCETLDDQSFEESIRAANNLEGELVNIGKEINTSFTAFKEEEDKEHRYLESLRKDFDDKLKLKERMIRETRIQRRIDSNKSLSDQTAKKKIVERQKNILLNSTVRDKFIQVEQSKKTFKDVTEDVKRIRNEVNVLKKTIKPVEQYKETEHIDDFSEKLKRLNSKLITLRTVSLYREHDIDLPGSWITGCIVHADRNLVLCDRLHSKLIMLSLDNKFARFTLTLDSSPYGIAGMKGRNEDILLVTMPEKKTYLKVRINNSRHTLSIDGSFSTDNKGFGIATCGHKIFICCRDDSKHGHVEVRERDSGRLLKTLGKGLLSWPKDVKLSQDEKRLYLCDSETGFLSCLSLEGWLLSRSVVEGSPSGLSVVNDDNILVCQTTQPQVSAIYRDDVSRKTLLTKDDGIVMPASVAYQDETLVIGMEGGCKVYKARI